MTNLILADFSEPFLEKSNFSNSFINGRDISGSIRLDMNLTNLSLDNLVHEKTRFDCSSLNSMELSPILNSSITIQSEIGNNFLMLLVYLPLEHVSHYWILPF